MSQKRLCCAIVWLVVVGFLGCVVGEDVPVVQEKTIPSLKCIVRSPIRINSDVDFDIQFPSREISGYEINGTGYGCCIFIGNCSKPFTVKDNWLHNANGRDINYFSDTGLLIYKSINATVSNNNCSDNGHFNVQLTWSSNNTLIGNDCSRSNVHGILLDAGSTTNIIVNNNFSENGLDGIILVYSSKNILINNTFFGNSYHGVHLFLESNNNIISNNNCFSNNHYGIKIENNSNNNHIYNNTLIENNGGGKQAFDNIGTNFWNDTYPSAGNYWSDWNSPDVYKGPNQDQPGSDGIVDSPYVLDGGWGMDYYPITKQIVVPEPSPAPLIIISVLLITAILVRLRKR